MLDDFLKIASSAGEVSTQLRRFLDFCEECGIPIAPEKTEGSDQKLAFLGITRDVVLSLAILPDDKLSRCCELLREAMTRKTMTLKELQSLLGQLNFACRVVVPGRAFLRRVYALTQKVQKHYHHVKITKEVRADFETWYHFLSEYNGRSFFLLDAVHTDPFHCILTLQKPLDMELCWVQSGCTEHGRRTGRPMISHFWS